MIPPGRGFPCIALSLLVLAASAAGAPVPAQQRPAADSARQPADPSALDSLRARLARAEAAIALLREQLSAESESAVRTKSRLHLELSAQVLTNVFVTLGRVNNVDDPQTVLAPPGDGAAPASNDALGFT
ncbi:MAG: hypothetical protein M3303_09420, partial [Gemmatimonadota bacterium]|nr:hypothetical protein [Gemmatimonadota bacterium]